EEVENSPQGVVDHLLQAFRAGIERRHRRIDDRAPLGGRRHRAQMTEVGGGSRTIRTSRRRSLRTTSAARVSNDDVTPVAISERLRIEQGAITMPSVRNDPLEMEAPILSIWCTTSASAVTSATLTSSSWVNAIDR